MSQRPIYGITQPDPAFGPAHPSFWAGQWSKYPFTPTFENYNLTAEVEYDELHDLPQGYPRIPKVYSSKHPYWGSNYFYTHRRPARWQGTSFMWSGYFE